MPLAKNNSRRILFIKYWLPVIIYAGFIFYLSSIPGDDIPNLFTHQDVVFHIVEYGILAFLINRALKADYPGWIYMRRILWVLFLSFIYAISDEFHQVFVPNREPALIDLAYDSIGIFIPHLFEKGAGFMSKIFSP